MTFAQSIFYVFMFSPLFVLAYYIRKPQPGNMVSIVTTIALMIALAIGISGNLNSGSNVISSFSQDLINIVMYGLIGFLLQMTALTMVDKVILNNINNSIEVENGNWSVGIVEIGVMFATAIVIQSSMVGDGSLFSMLLFFFLSQLVLIGTSMLMVKFNVFDQTQIADDYTPSAILWAAKLIAIAQITSTALVGPEISLMSDVMSYAVYIVFGMLLLIAIDYVTDEILIRKYFEGFSMDERFIMKAGSTITISTVVASAIV